MSQVSQSFAWEFFKFGANVFVLAVVFFLVASLLVGFGALKDSDGPVPSFVIALLASIGCFLGALLTRLIGHMFDRSYPRDPENAD